MLFTTQKVSSPNRPTLYFSALKLYKLEDEQIHWLKVLTNLCLCSCVIICLCVCVVFYIRSLPVIAEVRPTILFYFWHRLFHFNTWLRWISWQRQLQDETGHIYVLGFGETYIRCLTVYLTSSVCNHRYLFPFVAAFTYPYLWILQNNIRWLVWLMLPYTISYSSKLLLVLCP